MIFVTRPKKVFTFLSWWKNLALSLYKSIVYSYLAESQSRSRADNGDEKLRRFLMADVHLFKICVIYLLHLVEAKKGLYCVEVSITVYFWFYSVPFLYSDFCHVIVSSIRSWCEKCYPISLQTKILSPYCQKRWKNVSTLQT